MLEDRAGHPDLDPVDGRDAQDRERADLELPDEVLGQVAAEYRKALAVKKQS